MREVLDDLLGWWERGEPAAAATVVATWSSAPRPAGAAMVVGKDGTVVGSVSGGCVESAVYEVAHQVLATGRPALQRYGVSGDDAFEVGLTCGGAVDVYVERVDRVSFPELPAVAETVRAGAPVAVVTCVADRCGAGPARRGRTGRRLVVWPDQVAGSLGSRRLDAAAADDVRGMLAAGRTGTVRYGHDGERRGDDLTLFAAVYGPRPRMIVCGAVDFAAAVARVGDFLGYRVTVCDARPVFATRRRFPAAAEVVVDWPHRYLAGEAAAGRVDGHTVVCVLTHDPKFDVPVLEVALRLPLGYVGAMGSRRTHDDRVARLAAAGLTPAEIAKLASPIGLDLGARTPEETAVSIAAEIVAVRWAGTGERLSATTGRIHHDTPVPSR